MYPASSQFNMTYTIKAPKDYKIDFRIIEFELAVYPQRSCEKCNDYSMVWF